MYAPANLNSFQSGQSQRADYSTVTGEAAAVISRPVKHNKAALLAIRGAVLPCRPDTRPVDECHFQK